MQTEGLSWFAPRLLAIDVAGTIETGAIGFENVERIRGPTRRPSFESPDWQPSFLPELQLVCFSGQVCDRTEWASQRLPPPNKIQGVGDSL